MIPWRRRQTGKGSYPIHVKARIGNLSPRYQGKVTIPTTTSWSRWSTIPSAALIDQSTIVVDIGAVVVSWSRWPTGWSRWSTIPSAALIDQSTIATRNHTLHWMINQPNQARLRNVAQRWSSIADVNTETRFLLTLNSLLTLNTVKLIRMVSSTENYVKTAAVTLRESNSCSVVITQHSNR